MEVAAGNAKIPKETLAGASRGTDPSPAGGGVPGATCAARAVTGRTGTAVLRVATRCGSAGEAARIARLGCAATRVSSAPDALRGATTIVGSRVGSTDRCVLLASSRADEAA